MTRIATSWLVYRLTGSAWMLGIVGFMGQIPTFLLAPFAGVWIDRWNKRTVLVWTQALAALTLTHRITIGDILALSVMQGLINAFDMPGRQSFLVEMVDENAIWAMPSRSTLLSSISRVSSAHRSPVSSFPLGIIRPAPETH